MSFAYIHHPYRKPEEKKYTAKIIWGIVLLLAFSGGFLWIRNSKDNPPREIIAESAIPQAEPTIEKRERLVEHTVVDGDIPADIFSASGGWDANDTAALLKSGENIFDFSKLTIGKKVRFYFGSEEKAQRLEYEPGTEKIIIASREGKNFEVRAEKINYEVSEETARGTIDNFFYADALEAGLQEPTVLEVGDIFSFSIDFTTEIRVGDEFVFVYEKRRRDGEDAPDGRVLAAKFVNEGVAHYAYYFASDGSGGYYDGEGRVLERQFLKAPLSYRQITSGFSGARYHPITRTISAHYQIDYAAATGTPVVSTARGSVVSAGWDGGWGRIIRLRHDNGFTTHYAHLSAFAKGIRSGASISQGQVIGYVGSTGWSTGPHLDFGMKLNGAPINPLKLDLPKGAPLDEVKMEEFNRLKNQYANILN